MIRTAREVLSVLVANSTAASKPKMIAVNELPA